MLSSVASSNIAFFSESRIRSLSIRLGNDKLREVVERIDEYINARMNPSNKSSSWVIQFRGPSSPIQVSKEATASYIGGDLLAFPSLPITSGLLR